MPRVRSHRERCNLLIENELRWATEAHIQSAVPTSETPSTLPETPSTLRYDAPHLT